MARPTFMEKTFMGGSKTAKFMKVFSLENFPLYSMHNTENSPLIDTKNCLKRMFLLILTCELLSGLRSTWEGVHPPSTPTPWYLLYEKYCTCMCTYCVVHYNIMLMVGLVQ